jgi:serine/threonine-protein kinase RsbT
VAPEMRVVIARDGDIVTARQMGRELAVARGFSSTEQTLIATAISEIARNIVEYADHGEMLLSPVELNGRPGLMVVAVDQGPGIEDPARAMRAGYSTGKSLGMGLPGAKRLMDEFELETAVGHGTTITMKKWVR